VKEAVWLTTRHTPGAKADIALFATRRGGSTWLMEVIGAAPGFRSLDQPFSVMTANLTPGHYRSIPKYHGGEIVSPTVDDLASLHRYVEKILGGEIPVNAPYRFWKKGFRRKTSRQVLKIVGAKSMVTWLDDNFDLDIVILTRHPITQAASCIRNSWTLTVPAYLDNKRFVEQHLQGDLESRCQDVMSGGTLLDKFVLNWGLENLVPLTEIESHHDWTHVAYEATVLRPEDVVADLAARLDIDNVASLLKMVRQPSRSSGLSTASGREAMVSGDGDRLLRQPLESVDLADRVRAMSVLEELGIDIYRPDEIEPRFRR
jgi:hypothetical protein